MSLDPAWLIVGPLLLGHVGLFIVATNLLHASGLSDRVLDVLNLILLGTLVILSGLIAGQAVAGPWATWPWILRAYALACLATALVGLPLTTLLRKGRQLPAGISGKASQIDLAELEGKESLIGPGKYAWMLRLPGNESFLLKKLEWEIAIPNLPAEWDGLSLVHLTDLHFAPCFRRRFFEAVADEAAAWEADIVAFTGDLIDHDAAHDWVVPVMSRLRGRLGTFSILGHHDLAHDPGKIRQARPWPSAGRPSRGDPGSTPVRCPRPTTASCSATPPTGSRRRPDPESTWSSPVTTMPARSASPWSARSSCPASIPGTSTAASSARAGRCCTSARGSRASTRSATATASPS
jgi:hypothetical protein